MRSRSNSEPQSELIHYIEALMAEKSSEREDEFKKELPDNFSYYQLVICPNLFEISSLRLMIKQKADHKLPSINDYNNAVIIIKFYNKRYLVLSINEQEYLKLEELFKDNNAKQYIAYSRKSIEISGVNPWLSMKTSEFYATQPSDPILDYYNPLYQKIVKHIIEKDKIDYLAPIIIDGGCGDTGALLKMLEEAFKKQGIEQAKLMGFDFNLQNIENCYKEYSGNIQFLQGNLLKIQKILKQWRTESRLLENNSVILILSGSLTRLVMKDSFQALEVLKQIALDGHIDYLIGGGAQAPLITNYIAKQIGYQEVAVSSQVENFFIYKKMSPEAILLRRAKKLEKSNTIDLSLSPNPLELLARLEPFINRRDENSLLLDLSFVNLTEELIQAINVFLQKFPKTELCYWHNEETEILNFTSIFSGKAFFKSLKLINDEGYLMASRSFFSRLHERGFFNPKISSLKKSNQLISLIECTDSSSILEVLFVYLCELPQFMAVFRENFAETQVAFPGLKILWIEEDDYEDYEDSSEEEVFSANQYCIQRPYHIVWISTPYGQTIPYYVSPDLYESRNPELIEANAGNQKRESRDLYSKKLWGELQLRFETIDERLFENYLDDLINKVFCEKETKFFLILMKILCQKSTSVEGCSIEGYLNEYNYKPAINLKKEMAIYYQLATIAPYSEIFDFHSMQKLAEIRLNSNQDSPYFAEAKNEMMHYFSQCQDSDVRLRAYG